MDTINWIMITIINLALIKKNDKLCYDTIKHIRITMIIILLTPITLIKTTIRR